jgi:O-antigen ligase/tetratricopeptide (TPR) repeat protein
MFDALPAPAAPPRGPTSIHQAFTPLLRWLVVAALFASYPVALFVPMGTGFSLVFHFAAPLFTVLTLVAAAHLAITPVQGAGHAAASRRLGFILVLWLYVALHLAAAAAGRTADWFRLADTAGMVVLAALFAVGPARLRPRRLDLFLLSLWCVQVVHCGLQALAHYEPVALAGNRNWAATLLAVLAPWACFALRRLGGPRRGMSAPLSRILLQGAVVVISLVIVYACHCRATWLGLALYALVMFMLKPCSWPKRVLLLAVLLAVATGAIISYPEKIARAIERDIRLPLYASTIRMVADHPYLGVGPGNFARDFVTYRSTAQKARAVAAPVTEHPHCELLDVGVAVGVLGALLWAFVFVTPLVLPTGNSPYRRLAHASLWVLVVHGMLDKTLVQPPTSVLAVVFAGLLWRPWIRLRADPRRRPAWLDTLRLPLAVAVLLLSLYVAGRDLWQGALFRRAYLAEAQGQYYEARGDAERARSTYARAYDAYVLSTRVAPRNVRSHAYAGICANNKLRDPERALRHIQNAMAIEPDFAHLNGEAGLALGTLGRHEEAFAFFARESQIFPFDVEPLQRLFLCAAVTNRLDLLAPLHAQLMATSSRKASVTLGAEELRSLGMTLRVALADDRPRDALAAANAIAQPLESGAVEPPLYGCLDRRLVEAIRLAPFGALDVDYWRQLEAARQRWVETCPRQPADLLALARTDGALAPEKVATLLDIARLAGYSPARLLLPQSPQGARFVELSRDADRWLLDLDRGVVLERSGLVSLYALPAVRDACGISSDDLRGGSVIVPAHPLQFFYRTQALGAVVQQTCAVSGIPLAFSPMVEATRLQMSLAQDLQTAGLPPDTLTVAYDTARISAFGSAVNALMEAQAGNAATETRSVVR